MVLSKPRRCGISVGLYALSVFPPLLVILMTVMVAKILTSSAPLSMPFSDIKNGNASVHHSSSGGRGSRPLLAAGREYLIVRCRGATRRSGRWP